MAEYYKGKECTKNQWADRVVNFLNFSDFGKNQDMDEEMKAAKEAYKQELKDAGCKFDYDTNRYYFTTDRKIDRERVDESCNKYRDIIYRHNHPDYIPKTKDTVIVDLGAISAEERKSRHVQILLKPSVYDKIKAGAENFGLTVNDYINKVFENLTYEKKVDYLETPSGETNWKPKRRRKTS